MTVQHVVLDWHRLISPLCLLPESRRRAYHDPCSMERHAYQPSDMCDMPRNTVFTMCNHDDDGHNVSLLFFFLPRAQIGDVHTHTHTHTYLIMVVSGCGRKCLKPPPSTAARSCLGARWLDPGGCPRTAAPEGLGPLPGIYAEYVAVERAGPVFKRSCRGKRNNVSDPRAGER